MIKVWGRATSSNVQKVMWVIGELGVQRPPMPGLEAWYQRLQARPAYAEHVMVPFASLMAKD